MFWFLLASALVMDQAYKGCIYHPPEWTYYQCSKVYMLCAANMPDGWYRKPGYYVCPAK